MTGQTHAATMTLTVERETGSTWNYVLTLAQSDHEPYFTRHGRVELPGRAADPARDCHRALVTAAGDIARPPLEMPGHPEIGHPALPLLPGCRLVCMMHFGLRLDTWLALGDELELSCTVGELTSRYGADFTAIRGIGPSRAGELRRLLAAAGYRSPPDIQGP